MISLGQTWHPLAMAGLRAPELMPFGHKQTSFFSRAGFGCPNFISGGQKITPDDHQLLLLVSQNCCCPAEDVFWPGLDFGNPELISFGQKPGPLARPGF